MSGMNRLAGASRNINPSDTRDDTDFGSKY
jgi:hypothetical protein